jgi:hypothetical protein
VLRGCRVISEVGMLPEIRADQSWIDKATIEASGLQQVTTMFTE